MRKGTAPPDKPLPFDPSGVEGSMTPQTKGQRLMLAEKTVVHSPEMAAFFRDQQIQTQAIGQFAGLIPLILRHLLP